MKYSRMWFIACFICTWTTLHGQARIPASQRELNGYLLGEDAKPLAAGFDSLIKEQKYSDGWIDRVYSLDTARSAYMVFGFSDSSEDCLSIQITGKAETAMRPFLGLKLGDPREKVNQVLGLPTRVQHLQAPYLEFLQYAHRNYSVELDSLGNLWSIRILGYNGFPAVPIDSLPNLRDIFQSLQSNDPETILDALAPDFECILRDSIYTFAGSALDVIDDRSSRMSQLLYSGQSSLAALDESLIRNAILDPESVKNNKLTPTFRFPETSFVKDIVFVVHAGKWRIWEARLSR